MDKKKHPPVHLLTLVKRTMFARELRIYNYPDEVGMLLPWKTWRGNNSELAELGNGGVMWAVTVRPEGRLWLIACYRPASVTEDEDTRPRFIVNAPANKVPIADITNVAGLLTFKNRKGIDTRPKVMPHSMQMIGILTDASIALLERAAGASMRRPGKRANVEPSADEGDLTAELSRRQKRDAKLRRARLKEDGFTCLACDFVAPVALANDSTFVVEVHHIHPLKDTGEVTTKLSDLVTLCPTCHRLIHALAKSDGRTKSLTVKYLAAAMGQG